jgi:hypothetical protein
MSTSHPVGGPTCRQHPAAVVDDTCTTVDSDDHGRPRAADAVAPIREAVRPWVLQALVAAYGGDTPRLLIDLADLLGASVPGRALRATGWSGPSRQPRRR